MSLNNLSENKNLNYFLIITKVPLVFQQSLKYRITFSKSYDL